MVKMLKSWTTWCDTVQVCCEGFGILRYVVILYFELYAQHVDLCVSSLLYRTATAMGVARTMLGPHFGEAIEL